MPGCFGAGAEALAGAAAGFGADGLAISARGVALAGADFTGALASTGVFT